MLLVILFLCLMFLQRDSDPHDSDRSFSQRHHRNHYDRQEQQHQQQQLQQQQYKQQHQQQPQWSRKSRGRSRGTFTRERVTLFVNLYIHFFPVIVFFSSWRYTTHSGCVFYGRLSGFSLLAYEVT